MDNKINCHSLFRISGDKLISTGVPYNLTGYTLLECKHDISKPHNVDKSTL